MGTSYQQDWYSCQHAGTVQPFRYRGYIYDEETTLYYLGSRYYNEVWSRLISSDVIFDTDTNLLKFNIYIYVANNPASCSDINGNWIIKDAIKWFSKNVVEPIVDACEDLLENVDFTFSVGFTGSISLGFWSYSFAAGVLLMLGYKSKTASLVFPCCYNLRLGGTLCPIDDDIFIKNEILLCAFDRLDDGSFEIGFAISDNSYIVFSSTSLAVKCIRPQENGSHCDCDYVLVSNHRTQLAITSDTPFSFNASAYTQEELTEKAHNYELVPCDSMVLCIDYAQNGVGSNSCGPKLRDPYRLRSSASCSK